MNLTNNLITKLNESELSNSINSKLNFLIKDEEEAIEGYNNALNSLQPKMTVEQFNRLQEVLTHIIGEENEHIKELKQLKSDLGISK